MVRPIHLSSQLVTSVLATCALVALAHGDPVIESVDGTLMSGETVSIQGRGFGSKPFAKPLFYFPFGDGATVSDPTLSRSELPLAYGEIVSVSGGIVADFTNDGASGGSATGRAPAIVSSGSNFALRRWFGGVHDSGMGIRVNLPEAGINGGRENLIVFWREYHTWTDRAGPADHNWKVVRFSGGDSARNQVRLYENGHLYLQASTGSDFERDDLPGTNMSRQLPGVWTTHLLEHVVSDIDRWNGIDRWFYEGSLNVETESALHRTAGNPGMNHELHWYEYTRGQNEDDYTFFDVVYVDNSLARVFISDSPTWTSNRLQTLEIQVPVEWSDTQISVALRAGPLLTLPGRYLYVFDSTGKVNEFGYPLCTKCPKAPSLTAQ